jgi:fluoride exporter
MLMPIPLSLPLLVVIAVGGAAGAVARYILSGTIQSRVGGTFPWGTLAVNAGGCFLAGVIAGIVVGVAAGAGGSGLLRAGLPGGSGTTEVSAFLLPGLLGGLTTFSTFAGDVVVLAHSGSPRRALLHTTATVALGVGGASAGVLLGAALRG